MRSRGTPPPESVDMGEEERILIELCCSLSMRAHHHSSSFSSSPSSSSSSSSSSSIASPFILHSLTHPSPCSIFAFPGSWCADDWICGGRAPFGDSEVDSDLFPSLKSIGPGVVARVNAAFLSSFRRILTGSTLQSEVYKAITEKKRVIFTGHSTGGSIAALATIWLLENCMKSGGATQVHPFCVTFGSPLFGDCVLIHALEREGWSRCFVHFVMTVDIVPRILLTPLSSCREEIQAILHFLSPKASDFSLESIGKSQLVSVFYETVLRSALSVSSYLTSLLMGCTNSILGSLTSFIELSPYRPVGTYVFCTSKGQLVAVKSSYAIMQLLFYCLQLAPQQQMSEVAYRSLNEHWQYDSKIKQCVLGNVDCINYLDKLSPSLTGGDGDLDEEILGDLELSKEASLSLCAAIKWEKQRQSNRARIDANCSKIQEALNCLNDYKATCEIRGLNYYDSFKLHRNIEDFDANVKRIELAGLWDEIVEMLRRHELPDSFENRAEWINLGTRYRRLVEPLDIANYYRHSKNEDTGSYMYKGRPRRYRYSQKWYEQAQRLAEGSSLESCFWAMVEEIQIEIGNKPFEDVREKVTKLESEANGWFNSGYLGRDVFLGNSSFVVWWKSLPEQHRLGSCITRLVCGDETLWTA
ncbi:Protein EDS1L [Ananas comosus]|uniref:Protein EDS1L n=1 Tax=Ananas comosus TaxID=4615 RepID=A0A199UDN0_ANACO|nr:Protein EDS1L [Ananas comosus]